MSLTDLLDHSPDLLVLFDRATLQVLDARGRTESLTATDVRGKSMADVVPGGSPELFENCLARRHDPHPDVPLRVQVRDDEGHESPADIRLREATPGVVLAVIRHVSQRARVAERELISVTCAVPVAILTWGFDGALVSCNPAGERLYGLDGNALGQPVSQLMSAPAWQEVQQLQQRLLAGERVEPREVSRLKRSGEQTFQVEVEETLFLMRDVAGHPVRFGSYGREATELVRLRHAAQVLSRTNEPVAEPAPGPMRAVLEAADVAAADGRVTVLLLGETGVGKSRLARRIHARGPRANGPFLELNCAGLEPQLLESELFGHERGAFTGAMRTKRGLVEAAAGGTLLLDEVGELPSSVQAKLLTFLDERTFRRIGGESLLKADVRLIAATNSDLDARVADGTFRKDLFYRLNVLPLTLPPLRERRDEVPALAQVMLCELRPHASLSQEAVAALVRHAWPGNLRELRNVLERALLNSGSTRVELADLPVELRLLDQEPTIDERLRSASRRHIEQVLDAAGGNRSAAAQILGISRSTLRRRLRN